MDKKFHVQIDSYNKYEKPFIEKETKMLFPFRIMQAAHPKQQVIKNGNIVCKQCSSCHGCK